MAKTKEELNVLEQDCEALATKLQELTEDELKQITGGRTGLEDLASLVKFAYYSETDALQISKAELRTAGVINTEK